MKCKKCNVTDPVLFYARNKSKCKSCILLDAAIRYRGGVIEPTKKEPKPHLCKGCGISDPSLFYKKVKSKCMKCSSSENNERYHSLSVEDKELYKRRVGEVQDNNILHVRFQMARSRSKKRGVEFAINEQYINLLWNKQEGKCFYTGLEMKQNRDNNRMSVSIDRIDPSIGYVEGNVVLCCSAVNIMKNDLTLDEFKNYIQILHENIVIK